MHTPAPTIGGLRTLLGLIALGLALAVAGCGGSSTTTTAQPKLPRAIAANLADKSDAIADALDAGDACKAAQLADELKDAVESALAGGQVPAAFRAELERNASELQNDVNCPPPPAKPGKGKGHHKKGETTTAGTTTLSTTTEESG